MYGSKDRVESRYSLVEVFLCFFFLVSSSFKIGCLHNVFETFGFFRSPSNFLPFSFPLFFFCFLLFSFFVLHLLHYYHYQSLLQFLYHHQQQLVSPFVFFCCKHNFFISVFISSWFCSPSSFWSSFSIFFSLMTCCKKLLELIRRTMNGRQR